MPKSSTFANQFLALILNGTSIPGLAQNIISSPNTQVFIALHTANPTAGGNQASSEAAYTGYSRVAVNRNSGAWTVSANVVSPNANITFPACTGGTETETYASIGLSPTGAGEILWSGPISPPISVSNGVTPQLLTGSTITET